MSQATLQPPSATAVARESEADRIERSEIDASTSGTVLLFFSAAIFWLIVGSLFALVASFKLNIPDLEANVAGWFGISAEKVNFGFLTFGRLRSVHLNAVAYGWSVCAGVGTGIWLMARLCRTKLVGVPILITAAVIWNVGLIVGMIAILSGDLTSIEWLEMPTYATGILAFAYGLIAIWAVMMFRYRKPGHVYVSQWYLIGAFFWFPWLYTTAQILLLVHPVQGVVQSAINWWYGHNALGLWFTPIGLASAYYFIPKVLGRPVHSYYLSIVGFWTLAFFYSWNGMHHLIGGPLPAWLVTASVVASIMMIIPVTTTAINHHMTMKGNFEALKYSPTLRFVVFGAVCYTLSSLQGSSMAIPSWNGLTHFTHYTVGHAHLGLYGFFTMIMFGSMYYIVPRLTNWEWPSATLIRIHFWFCALGILLMFGSLSIGGILQGYAMGNPKIDFVASTSLTLPFLWLRGVAGIMMTIGHVAFAISFILMLARLGNEKNQPTLFGQPEVGGTQS
jgi:cytochrome c oxidase cbb3-type subunit 1